MIVFELMENDNEETQEQNVHERLQIAESAIQQNDNQHINWFSIEKIKNGCH